MSGDEMLAELLISLFTVFINVLLSDMSLLMITCWSKGRREREDCLRAGIFSDSSNQLN